MDTNAAKRIVRETFQNPFDKERFTKFIKELFNKIEVATFVYRGNTVPQAYQPFIHTLERLGKYTDAEGNKLDILIVRLKKVKSIEHARTMQRNFVAWYLNGSRGGELKDAAIVAFYTDDSEDWRFSLIKMDYQLGKDAKGKNKVTKDLTPAKRFSFLVGKNENSHTAQKQLLPILEDDQTSPLLSDLETAFNIEIVTKEFFAKYRELFLEVKEALDKVLETDSKIKQEFSNKAVETADFAKKLLGQIVFLYFLQKKGWFGVERDSEWGTGPKDFLRRLYVKRYCEYKNFFNDVLEPLFYNALAVERQDDWSDRFNCKIPFLNGGLFDPLRNYDWVHTDIELPNDLFSNEVKDLKTGDIGTGILDIFDRYNFTVKEDEPLEKEVAVDPEMLGKVFENLLEVKDRKSKGTYYTPREIVHYMCQQSLINYLATEFENTIPKEEIEQLVKYGELIAENEAQVEKLGKETETYYHQLSKNIYHSAADIDYKLANIKVCDPAIGSGAFPVGMMSEIVKARNVLSNYLPAPRADQMVAYEESRTIYNFKRDCIQNSLYGVDIDPGAVEIAKLRLWLSLIVDEEDIKDIKPLPNLDYKIMQGNSLLEEFEGIKLFDEKLLHLDSGTDNKKVEELKAKEMELSSKLLSFYQKNPSWMKDKKLTRPIKLYELEQEMDRIKIAIKGLNRINNAESNNQRQDGFNFKGIVGAGEIWDELNLLHKRFFNVAQKGQKDEIKKKVSELEWELIEATLKEQGKVSALKKLEEFKKANTRPFFLWKLHFAEVFQERGGFDIAIGNPPYIQLQKDNGKLAALYEGVKYQTFARTGDIYALFYEKGFQILKNKGILSFITSNKWMRAAYGEKLRAYFINQTNPLQLIDCGGYQVFDATVDTNILIAEKSPFQNKISTCVLKKDFSLDNMSDYFRQNSNVASFGTESWIVLNGVAQSIKEKIEKIGVPLKNWDIQINYGIKTGLNEAFIIDEQKRKELIKKCPKADGIIRPILRGRDIQKYCAKWAGLYIIGTFPSLSLNIDDYQAVKEHLLSFGFDKLKQTGEHGARKKTNNKWFETQDSISYWEDFFKQKIVWKRIGSVLRFSYDVSGIFCLDSTCFATGKDMKFLVGYLNSTLSKRELLNNSPKTGTGDVITSVQALEPLRVPRATEEQKKKIATLVDKCIRILDKNIDEDISGIEKEIDKIIFQLYNLTPEEIDFIQLNKGF